MITPELIDAHRAHQAALAANHAPSRADRRAQLLTDWHVLGTGFALVAGFFGYSLIKDGSRSIAAVILIVAFLLWASAYFAPALIPHLSKGRRASEDTRLALLGVLADELTGKGYAVLAVDHVNQTVTTDRGVVMFDGLPGEEPHLTLDHARMEFSASTDSVRV